MKKSEIKVVKVGRACRIQKRSLEKFLGKDLSKEEKLEIDRAVKRTVREYGQTLMLLDNNPGDTILKGRK